MPITLYPITIPGKMSNKDTDDVLEFINSLPDSKPNTPTPKSKIAGSNDDFLEFLDELSAHERTSKSVGNSKGKFEPKRRVEIASAKQGTTASPTQNSEEGHPSSVLPQKVNSHVGDEYKKAEPEVGHSEVSNARVIDDQSPVSPASFETSNGSQQMPATGEITVDPLASISSWWTTEGSSRVSSLWGSLASNAHQLSETTFQIASNTSQQLSNQRHKFLSENSGVSDTEQILHITDKLNSILTTMSQQIKDGLIDKEDELMNILLVYDLNNVNYLDSLCVLKFNRVMDQVEGGIKTTVSSFNHKHEQAPGSKYYDLSMFSGKAIDGEKLCFANLDSSIRDYLKITDIEKLQFPAGKSVGDDINKSNVFIAIQPITSGSSEQQAAEQTTEGPAFIEANNADSFSFTMILKDITNNITILSKSQPFPLRWARWISGQHDDIEAVFGSKDNEESVDPSEWVKEWIQDGLGLAFAVLAQEYITRRMGI